MHFNRACYTSIFFIFKGPYVTHILYSSFVDVFSLHCILSLSHFEKRGPFNWTNLIPFHTRILCAIYGWNWHIGSEEDFCQCFIFCYFFLTHYGKWQQSFSFDWTWYPFTQGCFVQSLVEIGPVVLEKKIFKCHQCIFKFLLSPIEKWSDFHLKTVEIPFS